MKTANLDRFIPAGVFAAALALYGGTVAPSVSLWDSGEFIASADGLQVMHPPGAPLFILLGRVLAMFVPAAYVALAVNLVSVLASALTVTLVYLILRMLIARWAPGRLAEIGGALVGAAALAASDSFWFNAVEAEVYALATLLSTLIVWLTLRWNANVDAVRARNDKTTPSSPHHRDLILVAFLLGLSPGVHLMGVLTFFFAAPVVYFALAVGLKRISLTLE